MSWLELLLLALSLCVDTFAVSMSGSQSIRKASLPRIFFIALVFAVFQAGLTFIGWIGGASLHKIITSVDHWIAFILLLYIGVKMAVEGIGNIRKAKSGEETECTVNLLSSKTLVMSAVATSIDALAVASSCETLWLLCHDFHGDPAFLPFRGLFRKVAGQTFRRHGAGGRRCGFGDNRGENTCRAHDIGLEPVRNKPILRKKHIYLRHDANIL